MIGVVLVSHSKALAQAVCDLVRQMVGPDFPIAVAAGAGETHDELGTDAVHIAEVLLPFCLAEGAVVLMDLGSAVLSAQMALELIDPDQAPDAASKIRLCPAPIVEAAVAAAVAANIGGDLDGVAAEARGALAAKAAQLNEAAVPPPVEIPTPGQPGDGLVVEIVVDNPHGLHARPAARLVQLVGGFQADVQVRNLTSGRGPASARSLTGIALLQVGQGDSVGFHIMGEDAVKAAAAIRSLAADRFGEADGEAAVSLAPVKTSAGPGEAAAIPLSAGIAFGRVQPLHAVLPDLPEDEAGTPAEERGRLQAALARVSAELRQAGGGVGSEVMAAQALVLSDPSLVEALSARLEAGGCSAATAWRHETERLVGAYLAMEDAYLQARAADIRDIAGRVSRVLAGQGGMALLRPDPPAILVTDELLPSQAMACDPAAVLGILAESGSPSAHAAIIVRSLGIPMLVGQGLTKVAGKASLVAFDGATGETWFDPDPAVAAMIVERRRALHGRQAALRDAARTPAATLDGETVQVLANVGSAADAVAARDNGAEGIGLLRTEFLYLSLAAMPDETVQTRSLAAVLADADADVGAGPVVVRTPDIGADKPLSFLPAPLEHNPFLGVRGLRLSLRHPDFFASNLRAILRAGLERDLWIMVPMVTTPGEMQAARACLEAAHGELAATRVAHRWPVKLGMMVEVPAAAMTVERFVPHADFFSIGTNDLTQYILAAERGNGDLDALQDAAHPAVIRAIGEVCRGAGGRHVSVCGDAASDPLTAVLMIGAGVRCLSVRPNQVGAIKACIRSISLSDAQQLAAAAMGCDDGASVRRLAETRAFCRQ